jgi:hypothetical protein
MHKVVLCRLGDLWNNDLITFTLGWEEIGEKFLMEEGDLSI